MIKIKLYYSIVAILFLFPVSVVVNADEFVFVVAHLQVVHGGELMEAVAAFHAFHQIVVAFLVVHHVHAGLIHGEDVRGRADADIRNGRFRRGEAGAVAVDGHAAHE